MTHRRTARSWAAIAAVSCAACGSEDAVEASAGATGSGDETTAMATASSSDGVSMTSSSMTSSSMDDDTTTASPPACSGFPLTCWPPNDEICDGPTTRSECVDGDWQCPRGTVPECGHGDDPFCIDARPDCVAVRGGECTDLIVPALCDFEDWVCPPGSMSIEDCRADATTGSTDSGSSSGSGSSSTGG